MSAEVLSILGVGVSLAALILSGQRSLNTRMDRLEGRMDRLEAAIHALGERVARLEGAVPFLTTRPLPDPEKPAAQVSA